MRAGELFRGPLRIGGRQRRDGEEVAGMFAHHFRQLIVERAIQRTQLFDGNRCIEPERDGVREQLSFDAVRIEMRDARFDVGRLELRCGRGEGNGRDVFELRLAVRASHDAWRLLAGREETHLRA